MTEASTFDFIKFHEFGENPQLIHLRFYRT